MKKNFISVKTITAISMSLLLAMSAVPVKSVWAASEGKWMAGEFHTHTNESPDASEQYMVIENELDAAFNKYGEDFLFFADHLRMLPRDANGKAYTSSDGKEAPKAYYKAIVDQIQKVKDLKAQGKYTDKIVFSGFEWDGLGLDHIGVGLIPKTGSVPSLDLVKEFEYYFSKDTNINQFTAEDIAKFGPRENTEDKLRGIKSKANTFVALQWLKDNAPNSYAIIHHMSRKAASPDTAINIRTIRAMNDLAPNISFAFEGLPGNQLGSDRGELADGYSFGGADKVIAKLGGEWDALLGEGRHYWNVASSDYHFKVSTNGLYSSGYVPGEYAKNYVYVDGNSVQAVADGLRSGKMFGVTGDIINALDFRAASGDNTAEMGGDLNIKKGEEVTITIRFKSPETNNYAPLSPDHKSTVTNKVYLDHVDLISGEVTGKIDPSSFEYSKANNPTTKVLKRFTSNDWTVDAEGYNVITFKTDKADASRYYRLRGTNLGTDVPGITANGEPLADVFLKREDFKTNMDRFNVCNDRNYSNMWFYSNPIFVNVTK